MFRSGKDEFRRLDRVLGLRNVLRRGVWKLCQTHGLLERERQAVTTLDVCCKPGERDPDLTRRMYDTQAHAHEFDTAACV